MARLRSSCDVQSLGQMIRALKPGGGCPWCGAALEAERPSGWSDGRESNGRRPSGEPTLHCRECGIEVSEVECDSMGRAPSRLGAAA